MTSPPYHAGKTYETDTATGAAQGSYQEHLGVLGEVFAECRRVLEPGGRICANVANLRRRPYQPLAAHSWAILERVGFLARGEIIWVKARGAIGSAAVGSFAKASKPVLRDVTERVLVASNRRHDRGPGPQDPPDPRAAVESAITAEQFVAWTLDVWDIRPESATRIGHPTPFPFGLPRRPIERYTYRSDIVLDCFAGTGTTARRRRRNRATPRRLRHRRPLRRPGPAARRPR